MDINEQSGIRGYELSEKLGVPLIIMEPVKGGALANPPVPVADILKGKDPEASFASWALRWAASFPNVMTVLSGMSNMEQVKENIAIAESCDVDSMSEHERQILKYVPQVYKSREEIPCTGCRYCMPCPKGVDIPALFRCYNMTALESKSAARFEYAQTVGLKDEPAFATQCIGCGKCEQHCPQSIPIREMIKKADKAIRPLPYKIGINIARKIMLK